MILLGRVAEDLLYSPHRPAYSFLRPAALSQLNHHTEAPPTSPAQARLGASTRHVV
jgi:hypothetical protein